MTEGKIMNITECINHMSTKKFTIGASKNWKWYTEKGMGNDEFHKINF